MPRPPIADPGERQRRFEVVYAAHRGPILGYVLRRTGNPDDAADVIAETFLTAWRRLDEIPHDPQTRLWLYGVARRVLANHHRGERRRSALADRLRADLAVGYHPPEFDGEQAQITEAFRGLPRPTGNCWPSAPGRASTTGRSRWSSAARAMRCGSGCSARASGSPPNWPASGPGPLSPTSTSRSSFV